MKRPETFFVCLAMGLFFLLSVNSQAQQPQMLKADVVVIGSGGSGLVAGLTAAEGGARVMLFEKMAFLGGTSNFPAGILFLLEAIRQSIADGTPLSWVLKGAEVLALAMVIWWIVRPPKLIIPTWIQTIEDHPRPVYDFMSISVKNKEEWRSKVETPEALEEWIEAVEKRLKVPKKKKK